MAYEYEYEIRIIGMLGSVEDRHFIDLSDHKNELKEVYAKAKAWDNYLEDVENSVRKVTGNEDEVKWHVDYAINEYMEADNDY